MAMLAEKVAFVTGGASGIGRSTAIRFASEGAKVAIADVPQQSDEAHDVIGRITSQKGHAIFTPCDVSFPHEVQRAIEQTVRDFGRLDIVFANAGINGVWAPI